MTNPYAPPNAPVDLPPPDNAESWMRALTVCIFTEVIALIGILVLPKTLDDAVFLVLAFAWVASAIAYLIVLGKLAAKLGKSWILWVGLTILTNPLGTLVSYFMMRSRVAER